MSWRNEEILLENWYLFHETELSLIAGPKGYSPGGDRIAFPKSEIIDTDLEEVGDTGDITIPLWLAEREGLD